MRVTTYADLVRDLARLGVREGDTVMVHASMKAVGAVAGGAEAIVAALATATGATRCAIIP